MTRTHWCRMRPCYSTRDGMQSRIRSKIALTLAHVVLEAFCHKRPSPEHVARHKNGDTTDCRLVNLRWALPGVVLEHTPIEIVRDVIAKYRTGLWTSWELVARHVIPRFTIGRILLRAGVRKGRSRASRLDVVCGLV